MVPDRHAAGYGKGGRMMTFLAGVATGAIGIVVLFAVLSVIVDRFDDETGGML